MKLFDVSVVSVDLPSNRLRVAKLFKAMESLGFPKPTIYLGEKSPSPKDRNRLVFECHQQVAQSFLNNKKSKSYLLVLEDDAEACIDQVYARIEAVIKRVNREINPNWLILNLGCYAHKIYKTFPKDPDDPLGVKIAYGKGVGAASYLINRKRLLYHRDKLARWYRPHAVEQWTDYSNDEILMVQPIFFSQMVHTYHPLPGLKTPKIWPFYINTANWMTEHNMWLVLTVLPLVLAALLLCVRVSR